MHRVIISIIFFSVLLFLMVFYIDPGLLLGSAPFDASMGWTVFGGISGYFGFIFSLYAAMGVSQLSNRYFAKSRLPEIQKKIVAINQRLSAQASNSMDDLRSSQILPEVGVALRSLNRVKIKVLRSTSKSVSAKNKVMRNKLDKLSVRMSPEKMVNADDDFWALVSALSELADEIETYLKEEDARA